jgi:hypothetical protein
LKLLYQVNKNISKISGTCDIEDLKKSEFPINPCFFHYSISQDSDRLSIPAQDSRHQTDQFQEASGKVPVRSKGRLCLSVFAT